MGLANLPPERVSEGLTYVEKLVKDLIPEKDWSQWWKLFDYFNCKWMKIVKPSHFCVFRTLDRTDNKSETNNRKLNDLVGKKPSVPVFFGEIIKYFSIFYNNRFFFKFQKV